MKKTIRALMVIAALSVVSTSANAEWSAIDKNNEVTSYVDKNTIHRDGDIVVVSTLDDLSLPNKFRGGFYHSTIWLEGYDCTRKRHRIISSVFYEGRMGKGETIASFGPTQGWDEIHPNSASEKLWKMACEKN